MSMSEGNLKAGGSTQLPWGAEARQASWGRGRKHAESREAGAKAKTGPFPDDASGLWGNRDCPWLRVGSGTDIGLAREHSLDEWVVWLDTVVGRAVSRVGLRCG